MTRHLAGIMAALLLAAPTLRAQEALLPATGWGMGLAISGWHLATPIPQASGAVADVAEVAFPFRIRGVLGRWSVDLSGAGALGAVHLTADPSQSSSATGNNSDRVTSIAGPTDVKLRITGPIIGDNTLVTAGVNIPSGKVGLNTDETTALQAVGAPAMHMPIGAFGTGAGATLGIIQVIQGEDWAIAIGASGEQRSEYSPIAIALTSGKAETRITPGTAAHVTLGLDRSLGEGRWSLLFVGDMYSKDQLVASGGGTAAQSSSYTLGPQFSVSSQMAFAARAWREASFNVAARMRSAFSDATGAKVAGSSGTYLEASLGGVRGGSTGAGFIIGADARWHSGLTFTDALVGAATTAAGLTIGIERAGASTLRRWTLHGQYGTFDTGRASSSGYGVTLGLSVSARREAQ
jgi:hypothetical protein